MAGKLNKKQKDMVKFVSDGTKGAAGHALVPATEAEKIQAAYPGLLEIDHNSKDEKGNVKVRTTEEGHKVADEHGNKPAKPPVDPNAPKPTFTLQKGIP